MPHAVRIDALPTPRRLNVWRDAVCNAFVRLECRPDGRAPLHGRLESAQLGGLHVARVASSPQWVERTRSATASDDRAFVLVTLQLRGQTVVRQDGREAVLGPGNLAFYDTTRPYALALPRDFEQIVLHLPRPALEARDRAALAHMARRLEASSPYAQALVALGPQLLRLATGADAEAGARAAAAATELIALALRATAGPDIGLARAGALDEPADGSRPTALDAALVWRARDVIARRLGEPELSPGAVAAGVGVSLRRLQQAFQAHGDTLTECLWSMRLELARQHLADREFALLSVSQIALAAGFTDFAHFSRRFRARYGLSPSEYRQQSGGTAGARCARPSPPTRT